MYGLWSIGESSWLCLRKWSFFLWPFCHHLDFRMTSSWARWSINTEEELHSERMCACTDVRNPRGQSPHRIEFRSHTKLSLRALALHHRFSSVLSPNIPNISESFQVAIVRGSLAWPCPNRLGSVFFRNPWYLKSIKIIKSRSPSELDIRS